METTLPATQKKPEPAPKTKPEEDLGSSQPSATIAPPDSSGGGGGSPKKGRSPLLDMLTEGSDSSDLFGGGGSKSRHQTPLGLFDDTPSAKPKESSRPAPSVGRDSALRPVLTPVQPGTDPLSSRQAPQAAPQAAPAPNTGTLGTRDVNVAKERFAMPTWDTDAHDPVTGRKGMWVDASPADSKLSDKGGKIADKRMVKGVTAETGQAATATAAALKGGNLSLPELKALTQAQAEQINPLSDVPRNILKGPLKSSWDFAKHELGEGGAAGQMIMAKLWEFRQWHHDSILQKTKRELESNEAVYGKDALKDWSAAGSGAITSDIDVNLKGSNTEAAVQVFNRLFKADGFDYEPGVVYDVNVYAMDFMHAASFKKGGLHVQDEEGDHQVSAMEGSRKGNEVGGINTEKVALQERLGKMDTERQEAWSMVKMRLHMTDAEWTHYKKQVDPKNERISTWLEVEDHFLNYRNKLLKQMGTKVEDVLSDSKRAEMTQMQQIKAVAAHKSGGEGPAADNTLMAAQNRSYEETLIKVKATRAELNTALQRYNKAMESGGTVVAEIYESEINELLYRLRDMLSEGSLFSNEAYITDGAINHAVVGIQSGVGIEQTKAQSLHVINENVADIIKETNKHDDNVGDGLVKGGKYFWRLGDAAKNVGANKLAYVSEFYDMGHKLDTEIKGKAVSSHDKSQEAYALAQEKIGVNDPGKVGVKAIQQITRTLGRDVALWYNKNVRDQGKDESRSKKVDKAKH